MPCQYVMTAAARQHRECPYRLWEAQLGRLAQVEGHIAHMPPAVGVVHLCKQEAWLLAQQRAQHVQAPPVRHAQHYLQACSHASGVLERQCAAPGWHARCQLMHMDSHCNTGCDCKGHIQHLPHAVCSQLGSQRVESWQESLASLDAESLHAHRGMSSLQQSLQAAWGTAGQPCI